VRKRSYLDPGTETKARRKHYLDYARSGYRIWVRPTQEFHVVLE
jgi:hypothetical protein